MPNKSLKWIYLFVLSIIWGSSFILIKKGLVGAVVGILNSSVPLLAFIFGILLFGAQFIQRQFIGVLLGLVGAGALIYIGAQINEGQNYWYASLVIIAASFYALNVNIIKRHLQEVPAIAIAAGNFVFLIIPAAIILAISGFFDLPFTTDATLQQSIGYIVILSIFGTALAKVMFNKLVQMSNPVFASSVTYLMPIISVMWGLLDGEAFTMLQFIATLIILVGVYIGNSARRKA